MEKIIRMVEKDLSLEIKSHREIRSNVCVITTKANQQLLLKQRWKNKKNGFRYRLCIGLITHFSASLSKEAWINEQLLKMEFDFLKFPVMLFSDKKNYIIFEHIDSTVSTLDKVPSEEIVNSLWEFQNSGIPSCQFLHQKIYENFRSVDASIVRAVFKIMLPEFGLRKAFLTLKVLRGLSRSQKKFPNDMLVHKDFRSFKNFMVKNSRDFYIIDFEATVKEKRWIMIDIIDLAWDIEKMKIDYGLINEYAKILRSSNLQVNIIAQIRAVLLRKVIRDIKNNWFDIEVRANLKIFLCEVLLNDLVYYQWVENQKTIVCNKAL